MSLMSRLQDLKLKISNSLANIKIALTVKGVVVGNDLTISNVAKYIRQIHQEEFEFVFNFRDIDQFGSPHVPNTGQSIGGMINMTPNLNDLIIPEYDFTTSYTFGSITVPSGMETSTNVTISSNLFNPTIYELEPFNENTIPEVLNYDPSFS